MFVIHLTVLMQNGDASFAPQLPFGFGGDTLGTDWRSALTCGHLPSIRHAPLSPPSMR